MNGISVNLSDPNIFPSDQKLCYHGYYLSKNAFTYLNE
jgi:hypothetical protein